MILAGVEGADARRARRWARARKVAVDAVFDSVSVGTTFQKELAEGGRDLLLDLGGHREHPELVKKYLGSVVPVSRTISLPR